MTTKRQRKIPVVLRDACYVPEYAVDVEAMEKRYSRRMYDDQACAKCEHRPERHDYMCDTCPAYQGRLKLYKSRVFGGQPYIGLPLGERAKFYEVTGLSDDLVKYVDRRCAAEFEYPIKVSPSIQLRPYQEDIVARVVRRKYGLVDAPPRTGKTLMSLVAAIRLGYRMVFMADQHEFLVQFLDHVYGNEKEEVPMCTNIPALEKKTGKKLAGFLKKAADFENYQIGVITYQSLMHDPEKLKLLNRNFGAVFVDEVHSAAANEYARVVARLATKVRVGVTGTVKRKDGRQWILKQVIGPVVARTTVEMLPVKFTIHETEAKYKSKPKHWTYAIKALWKNEQRLDKIMSYVDKDMRAKRSIIIGVYHREAVNQLVARINKEHGKGTAVAFVGGGSEANKRQRKQILSDAKSYKVRVVVGIRRLMQRGLNVPRWDTIYIADPISNEPNLRQETSRIRTPTSEFKNEPLVRLFVDENLGQSWGCGRSTLKHMLGFKYAMSKTRLTRELAAKLLAGGRRDEMSAGAYDQLDDEMYAKINTDEPKRPALKSIFK